MAVLVRLDKDKAQQARKAAGVSQSGMARMFGAQQPFISAMEAGRPIQMVTALAYAYVAGVDVREILRDPETSNQVAA
jgi:DNA-binding XRE family transcriptional regulator